MRPPLAKPLEAVAFTRHQDTIMPFESLPITTTALEQAA
jgi:hypothetical protein